MASERSVYMGPRIKRVRRDLGLTQAQVATDLDISPSYVALIERNQRPVTADLLLRLARTYRLDLADLAGDGGAEYRERLGGVLKDPMFADIDLPPLEIADVATSFPGIAEALLRLYTAYQEEQLALADRASSGSGDQDMAGDPVAETQRFLAARRNYFGALEEAAERIGTGLAAAGGLAAHLKARHGLRVRRLPPEVLDGALRRFDRHRDEVLLSETLDAPGQNFQLALQLVYLEERAGVEAALAEGKFASETGQRLARRALASYAAAALLMPYADFARAAERRHFDVEALSRQFGTSFEQTAHRLTTLQRPGQERVPFFFIRVDQAGNVSKRLDGAGFPFARHGGACPLWSVHRVFQTPDRVVTQWLELPDGKRFFSIARTVNQGGGAWGAERVQRAVALGCAAEHAGQLAYMRGDMAPDPDRATPIGVACRLCQRARCAARAAPAIGRQVLFDDHRRASEPFPVSEG